MTSNSLPAPAESTTTVDVLQSWIENLAHKNKILEEENKSLKLENQRLMTEMEKMSRDLKKSEEENLLAREQVKIKTEPLETIETDMNMQDEAMELPCPPEGINPPEAPNAIHDASPILMVNERHNEGQERIVPTCKNCKKHMKTRHECIVCNDFNLCVGCYGKIGHPHRMLKIIDELANDSDSDSDSSPVSLCKAKQWAERKLSIQRCINSLVHSCQCKIADCRQSSCQTMKRVVAHAKVCKRKKIGGCPICKQLVALCCHHSKQCTEAKCAILFCTNIKKNIVKIRQRLALQKGCPTKSGAK